MKKLFLSISAMLTLATAAWAAIPTDYINPIITAMPSVTIAPDARAAGMGDLGVATDPDLNSQHWNAAKYAFMDSHGGITASYTPWLRKLVGDIDLAHIAGYYKWDDIQGVSGSFTYFSMGDVVMTGWDGTPLGNARPNEWSLDVAYSRKLHDYVSMAVAMRFLYSDMTNGANYAGQQEMHAAWALAADIDLFYKQPIDIPMGTSYFNLGFALTNLGSKMSYNEGASSNFIPANMALGVGYELPFDNYNKLTFNLQIDKLLVPSRYSRFAQGFDADDSSTWQMSQDAYTELNPVKGWFQSFGDAPYGALEEFKEVRWSAGLEYTYNRQFFARAGYSHEDFIKSNRNYVTLGAGFHLSIVTLDVSYCIALAATNPLDQTMRFTLGFDLAGIKDLVNNRK
ncbi:MAG: type IX secretion system outer membrane channel protein PorV [Paludibacteraceae bacterium]|nr:type IX secretion system outer membrane channel protein PorV [Paludibacteraceae bacterium]